MGATFYLALLAVLQVADYFSTRYALEEQAGNYEANPLLAWLFRRYRMRSVLIIKGVLVVAAVGYFDPASASWASLVFLVVVANNVRLIIARKKKR